MRTILIATLIATFTFVPRGAIAAGDETTAGIVPVQTDGPIRRAAQAIVPTEARLMRQVVATTNESKVFLGLVTGSAIVAGLAMLVYGSSSSCKGKPGNETTGPCDRLALAGSLALGAGGATLLLWQLSR